MSKKKEGINTLSFSDRLQGYRNDPLSFVLMMITYLATAVTMTVLLFVVIYILVKGIPNLKPSLFDWKYTSDNVSMMPAIINTITITILSLMFSVPVGIGAAVYLCEYAKRGNKLVGIVRITAETLTGIPSIVYGLFGALFFGTFLHLGTSLISGALTLAIMILPVIMRTTEEALLAVPDSYREGSYGLGAGRLRTIFRVILPAAVSGIFSGIVLGIGRIAGESAALIYTAGTFAKVATTLHDSARTLSVHMYVLSGESLYVNEAYASAVMLLIVVLCINFISGKIADKVAKGGTNGEN